MSDILWLKVVVKILWTTLMANPAHDNPENDHK